MSKKVQYLHMGFQFVVAALAAFVVVATLAGSAIKSEPDSEGIMAAAQLSISMVLFVAFSVSLGMSIFHNTPRE